MSRINLESTAQPQNLTTETVLALPLKEMVSSITPGLKMTPKCHSKSICQTEASTGRENKDSVTEVEANVESHSGPQMRTKAHEDLQPVIKIDEFFHLTMNHLIGGGGTLGYTAGIIIKTLKLLLMATEEIKGLFDTYQISLALGDLQILV